MLSSEEKVVLGDIKSLVEQLEQLDAGAEGQEKELETAQEEDVNEEEDMEKEEDAEKAEDEDDTEKAEDEEEADIDKEGEGNASEDAETRIEDAQAGSTEEAVSEVSKNINKIIASLQKRIKPVRKSVKKSRPDISPQLASIMGKLSTVVKTIAAKNTSLEKNHNSLEKAVTGILEGMGLADEIKKNYKAHLQTKKVPAIVLPAETEAVLKSIKDAISTGKPEVEDPYENNKDKTRTAMKSVMGQLFKK